MTNHAGSAEPAFQVPRFLLKTYHFLQRPPFIDVEAAFRQADCAGLIRRGGPPHQETLKHSDSLVEPGLPA